MEPGAIHPPDEVSLGGRGLASELPPNVLPALAEGACKVRYGVPSRRQRGVDLTGKLMLFTRAMEADGLHLVHGIPPFGIGV